MENKNSLIGKYRNGNYNVSIYSDGTKIRETVSDLFEPSFPESVDLKITNYCDAGCEFCHEDSNQRGKHGDILNLPFIDTIHPYTEIAIGGGNPLSHPDLRKFLEMLKEHKVIANITVNQRHFMDGGSTILRELSNQGLVYGVGISVKQFLLEAQAINLMNEAGKIPNTIFHMINGIHTADDFTLLSNGHPKILILGYKEFRRGQKLYKRDRVIIDHRKGWLYNNLPKIINKKWFTAVCFDNLAIKQLDVKRLLTEEEWEEFYMGDDGQEGKFTSASMYIDAVEMKFARNSCSEDRYPATDNIDNMYDAIKV